MGKRINLKLFRVKLGLSQEEMADSLGYSRNHYARIENGESGYSVRFMNTLQEKHNLFDAEVKELLKKEGE